MLVAASPCALAIAIPVTAVSAIGAVSRFGVVIKSGAAFEVFGSIHHAAFDKTGTLTQGSPSVGRVIAAPGHDEQQVLRSAAALERGSAHPLATAIVRAGPAAVAATAITEQAGCGLQGVVDGQAVTVGSPRWIDPGALRSAVDDVETAEMTIVVVHAGDRPIGAVGIRNELRTAAALATGPASTTCEPASAQKTRPPPSPNSPTTRRAP